MTPSGEQISQTKYYYYITNYYDRKNRVTVFVGLQTSRSKSDKLTIVITLLRAKAYSEMIFFFDMVTSFPKFNILSITDTKHGGFICANESCTIG